MADAIRPRVVAAIAGAIGSIPGCALRTVRGPGPVAVRVGSTAHALVVDGRSPSLHEIAMQWPIHLGIGDPADVQAADALAQIADRLAVQRTRAEAGLELAGEDASAFPLRISSMAPTQVRHLHADVSALALMLIGEPCDHDAARRGANPAGQLLGGIGHMVANLHGAASPHGGGATLSHDGVRVQETAGLRTLDLQTTVRHPTERRTSGVATLRGSCVIVPGATLPDTLAAIMPGRPLADAVDLGAAFAGRTVRSARTNRSGDLALSLEPVRVAIGDIEGMRAAQALTHIAGMTAP